jgi:triphosphoribosyl-dephospho-CoA synthetase
MDADAELFQRLSHIRGLVERLVQAVESGLPGAEVLTEPARHLRTCLVASRHLQMARGDEALLADDLARLAAVAQQARCLCDAHRVRGRALEMALAELHQEALDLQRQLGRRLSR